MRDEDLRAFERALETGDLAELQRIGPHVVRHARGLPLPESEERERIATRLEGWAAFWKARADRRLGDCASRVEGFARDLRSGGIAPPPDVQGPGIDPLAGLPPPPRDPLGILPPNFVRDLAVAAGATLLAGQAQRAMLGGFKLDRPADASSRKVKGRKRKRRA